MAVIENPIFTDFEFNKAKRSNEELDIPALLEANFE